MNVNSLNLALRQASRELSVPIELVEQVYRSYWSFIRETAMSLPLKTVTKEEVRLITTNFNIPYIGKLHIDYDQIRKYHNQLNHYQDVRSKENQADRHTGSGD